MAVRTFEGVEGFARLAGLLLLSAALACSSGGTLGARGHQERGDITNAKGTIQAVRPEANWWAIVPDADRGTRYAPDRLPDDFKKDGLRVVFSGRVKPIEPGVRSYGTPLELTSITRE